MGYRIRNIFIITLFTFILQSCKIRHQKDAHIPICRGWEDVKLYEVHSYNKLIELTNKDYKTKGEWSINVGKKRRKKIKLISDLNKTEKELIKQKVFCYGKAIIGYIICKDTSEYNPDYLLDVDNGELYFVGVKENIKNDSIPQ